MIEKQRLIRKLILSTLIMVIDIIAMPFLLIKVLTIADSGIWGLIILIVVVFLGVLPFCVYISKWIGKKYY